MKMKKNNCPHDNKIGDNYGLSCKDCGKQLSGYGYFARHKNCIHVFMPVAPDSDYKVCMYCERPEKLEEVENQND